ncbi:MAG: SDR family oxidoreductase [Kiritimatiellae bacterium]|nr:SDR family oxidoreductase [Kiritimatiellia bacterium]
MEFCNLTGKRVLITGASSGIGRACAIEAASLGASVILSGRREDALQETLGMMECPSSHQIIAGDIGDSVFVKQLMDSSGKLEGLVHAAGVCPAVPVGVIDSAALVDSMRINYFAFMELMKYCSKKRYSNEHFSAVAVSSVSAEVGWSCGALYSGSKGAISAAIRSLALELAPKGFRVNAVCPSNIKTPMFDSLAGEMNDEAGLAALKAKQPLGIGSPEQVAKPVCFLLSDAASFITGVNLPVDGGYLAQ